MRCLWWREPCKVPILTLLFRVGFLVLFSPLFYADVPPLVTWLIIEEYRLFWGCTTSRQCTSRVTVRWECLKVCKCSTLSLKFCVESHTDSYCVTKVLAFVILGQFHEFVVSWVLSVWSESCYVVWTGEIAGFRRNVVEAFALLRFYTFL